MGKTLLAERVARDLGASWISTDVLRVVIEVGVPNLGHVDWGKVNAIAVHTERFLPYLERFIWGVTSLGAPYVIEGVDFLPEQATHLAQSFAIRSVFLGDSEMTAGRLQAHLGRQPWLAGTAPDEFRQMAEHIVDHTKLVKRECTRFGIDFVDMAGGFDQRLREAAALLAN